MLRHAGVDPCIDTVYGASVKLWLIVRHRRVTRGMIDRTLEASVVVLRVDNALKGGKVDAVRRIGIVMTADALSSNDGLNIQRVCHVARVTAAVVFVAFVVLRALHDPRVDHLNLVKVELRVSGWRHVIVRIGIGYDFIDLAVARIKRINIAAVHYRVVIRKHNILFIRRHIMTTQTRHGAIRVQHRHNVVHKINGIWTARMAGCIDAAGAGGICSRCVNRVGGRIDRIQRTKHGMMFAGLPNGGQQNHRE